MNMDFEKLAAARYSARKFSDRPVEKEKLMKILEVGRLAPTAKNLQSQRIIAVTSPEGLEKVNKAYRCFGAPVVLVVCADRSAACDAPTTERNMAETDATIVATHMMLETYELGLGCTYVCAFKTAILKEELELDENIEPYAILPIGYPAEDCVPSERHSQRFPLEHTVKFI